MRGLRTPSQQRPERSLILRGDATPKDLSPFGREAAAPPGLLGRHYCPAKGGIRAAWISVLCEAPRSTLYGWRV